MGSSQPCCVAPVSDLGCAARLRLSLGTCIACLHTPLVPPPHLFAPPTPSTAPLCPPPAPCHLTHNSPCLAKLLLQQRQACEHISISTGVTDQPGCQQTLRDTLDTPVLVVCVWGGGVRCVATWGKHDCMCVGEDGQAGRQACVWSREMSTAHSTYAAAPKQKALPQHGKVGQPCRPPFFPHPTSSPPPTHTHLPLNGCQAGVNVLLAQQAPLDHKSIFPVGLKLSLSQWTRAVGTAPGGRGTTTGRCCCWCGVSWHFGGL